MFGFNIRELISSTTGGRKVKRKRTEQEDDNDDKVQHFIAKRPKKEIDFYRKEMKDYLRFAWNAAEKGDRNGLNLYLSKAKFNARKAEVSSYFDEQVLEIEENFGNEHGYHLLAMKDYLRFAMASSKDGDTEVLSLYLKKAQMNAQKAGALQDFLKKRK